MSERDDVFLYRSTDPHTAIPDWLAFCPFISPEARMLAHAIIVMSKGALPPTKGDIAEALGVDVRTVYRWLNELSASGVMTSRTVGRRNLYLFSAPDRSATCDHLHKRSANTDTCDQMTNGSDDHPISDRAITDRAISDRAIRHDPHDRDQFLTQQDAENGHFSEKPISDPPVGVGVGQHESDSDSTPTSNRAPLQTDLARWLKQAGMNAAREFDDPALDYATYRDFVEYKRSLGWEWRQIVSTLREAPLDPLSYAADPAFKLGSAADREEVESTRDHALRLLGPWTAENHQAQIRDAMFLQGRLGQGDTDAAALAALDAYRKAVRR